MGELHKDSDILQRKVQFVKTNKGQDLPELLALLSDAKYTIGDECMDSTLPLVIDIVNKTVSCMGNITGAAAASTQGLIIDADTFIEHFINVQYNDTIGSK